MMVAEKIVAQKRFGQMMKEKLLSQNRILFAEVNLMKLMQNCDELIELQKLKETRKKPQFKIDRDVRIKINKTCMEAAAFQTD